MNELKDLLDNGFIQQDEYDRRVSDLIASSASDNDVCESVACSSVSSSSTVVADSSTSSRGELISERIEAACSVVDSDEQLAFLDRVLDDDCKLMMNAEDDDDDDDDDGDDDNDDDDDDDGSYEEGESYLCDVCETEICNKVLLCADPMCQFALCAKPKCQKKAASGHQHQPLHAVDDWSEIVVLVEGQFIVRSLDEFFYLVSPRSFCQDGLQMIQKLSCKQLACEEHSDHSVFEFTIAHLKRGDIVYRWHTTRDVIDRCIELMLMIGDPNMTIGVNWQ